MHLAAVVALAAPTGHTDNLTEHLTYQRTAAVSASTSSRRTVAMLSDVPKACPITKPPVRPFVPPSPYPTKTGPDSFWFGTDKLWTSLPVSGTWSLPHYTPSDPTFRQKLFWWRQGYNWRAEVPPHLIVTGRRLDGTAPPLGADEANAGWLADKEHPFMVVGINFPTLGCWEVTGEYHGDRLTFVVWVAP